MVCFVVVVTVVSRSGTDGEAVTDRMPGIFTAFTPLVNRWYLTVLLSVVQVGITWVT